MPPGRIGWFLALDLSVADVTAIRFGSEGRDPHLLDIDAFLAAPDAVPALQARLRAMLANYPTHAVSGYHIGKTSLFP